MTDEGWEAHMAEKAAARRAEQEGAEWQRAGRQRPPDRSTWPVPEHLKGYSARDVFLWYVMDGWRRILGGDPRVVLDHDFGFHVVSDGIWQLKLVNLDEFPDERFPEPTP
jgi:hypothetical protein